MHLNLEPKSMRLLSICSRLQSGETLNKQALAKEFHAAARSIQRDIEDLRCFFAEQLPPKEVVYNAAAKGYQLVNQDASCLTNGEILAVCKILLESRSMVKGEMLPLLDKLVASCVPEQSKKSVQQLLSNEKFHYIQPHHGTPIVSRLWELGQAVQNHQVMEISYLRMKNPQPVKRTIEPVGLLFSEYYFYLTAFLQDVDRKTAFDHADDLFPTIYRVDRIRDFQVLDTHFQVPYRDRFEEGEFRKRVQFMYGGKLQTVRFHYTGPSVEAVLDRLPTAEIVRQDEEGWEIRAEVFGKGIEMWIRSQGENVKGVSGIGCENIVTEGRK